MSNLQITWIVVGLIMGFLLVIPIKRCFSTYNGLTSMLIASLMGIFSAPFTWVPVVIGLFCFSYGFYQNHHKYIGATND